MKGDLEWENTPMSSMRLGSHSDFGRASSGRSTFATLCKLTRTYRRSIAVALVGLSLLGLYFHFASGTCSDAVRRGELNDDIGYNFSHSIITGHKVSLPFAVVADLDKQSKIKDSRKPAFRSIFKTGFLKRSGNQYSIEWDAEHDMKSALNEAGRGMELSALTPFDGRLFTMDDRSGAVFEVTSQLKVVPRWIVMEGDGANGKGFKTEWATVKDGLLYVGSFGKEYTNPKDGSVTNRNNLWVKTISPTGQVTHIDWTMMYEQLRKATNTQFPGYMIIEAVEWSQVHRKWYILPRRVSSERYDDVQDERRGSNIMLVANEDFSNVVVSKVGTLTPVRGFSAFKFVPGTNDNVILALKSAENDAAGTQETFITLFTVDGRVLLEEELMGHNKFEGLAFV